MTPKPPLSIVLPAKNESAALSTLLPSLRSAWPQAEIIVVDDGSVDQTQEICQQHGAQCVCHPYSMGNGAAIKSGARAATGDILVFMDADGQHKPEDIAALLAQMQQGFDMVVGARGGDSQASRGRHIGNWVYNRLASWVTGHKVLDLTSGFRAVKADRFREFLFLLPNGFSYPTTITMAFFRSGYPVAYIPIRAEERIGKSHIRPVTDGLRFLVIIAKIATFYSPLKVFSPISLLLLLMGAGNYLYTYVTNARFTNMSAFLLIISVLVFLLGLISEQITSLIYAAAGERDRSGSKQP